MAEEWIKMRATILSDPRVLRITTGLAADKDFLRWWWGGTLGATATDAGNVEEVACFEAIKRCVAMTLLHTWAAANQLTADGLLRHAKLDDLDRVAGVPSFGRAMQSVGWADEVPEGVMLPRFLEHNAPAKGRSDAAERSRAYREKLRTEAERSPERSRALENVTEEKRREEKREEEKRTSSGSGASEPASTGKTPVAAAAAENADVADLVAALVKLGLSPTLAKRHVAETADPALIREIASYASAHRVALRNLRGALRSMLKDPTEWGFELTEHGWKAPPPPASGDVGDRIAQARQRIADDNKRRLDGYKAEKAAPAAEIKARLAKAGLTKKE